MLKSTIIYLPGTGGNMLYKTLTLSPQTITGTGGRDPQEYQKRLSVEEKLRTYLDWGENRNEWKVKERQHLLGYKMGLVDFFHYETSPLWLIDCWHPVEFSKLYHSGTIWGEKFYESIIFIEADESHKSFLLSQQPCKKYKLEWDTEYSTQMALKEQFKGISISVPFDCFFSGDDFLKCIIEIDRELNLDLEIEAVRRLYARWIECSRKVWAV